MTMHKAFLPKDDADRLYVSIKKEEVKDSLAVRFV